jgi:hypothetical protein
VFSSINRPLDVVFIDYLDVTILWAKSIACGSCSPSQPILYSQKYINIFWPPAYKECGNFNLYTWAKKPAPDIKSASIAEDSCTGQIT